MYAFWRFIFFFRRLSATTLPTIGGAAALASYPAKLALDEQFNELFKAAVPHWYQLTLLTVAFGAIGWGLGFLKGRPTSRWLERKAAGVWFEVPTLGPMTPFRFRNTGDRGPLGGAILSYDLAITVQARYNLRNVQLEIAVSDNAGRQVGRSIDPNFSGDVNRGFSTEIAVANLEIEYASIVSNPSGSPPHAVMSAPRLTVFNELVDGVAAFARYEIKLTTFHSSGPDEARLTLEILDFLRGPHAPGTVQVISGPIAII